MGWPTVVPGLALPKILGRGRPHGSGSNMIRLAQMKEGDSLVEVPKRRMHSIRTSAANAGIEVTCRKLPSGKYLIMRTK